MGIRICPNCNGKVSTLRNDCIHCGYVFPSFKKCPDCDADVEITAKECPECGHPFVDDSTIIEEEIAEPKEVVQEQSNDIEEAIPSIEEEQDDGITCPYCSSKLKTMIGLDYYMCNTCKARFLDYDLEKAYSVSTYNNVSNQSSSKEVNSPVIDNQKEPERQESPKAREMREIKERIAKEEAIKKLKKRYTFFLVLGIIVLVAFMTLSTLTIIGVDGEPTSPIITKVLGSIALAVGILEIVLLILKKRVPFALLIIVVGIFSIVSGFFSNTAAMGAASAMTMAYYFPFYIVLIVHAVKVEQLNENNDNQSDNEKE